jgi:hypothetical protein
MSGKRVALLVGAVIAAFGLAFGAGSLAAGGGEEGSGGGGGPARAEAVETPAVELATAYEAGKALPALKARPRRTATAEPTSSSSSGGSPSGTATAVPTRQATQVPTRQATSTSTPPPERTPPPDIIIGDD